MANHGSETRSRTKRKPFSDLANTPSFSTSTPTSTRTHFLRKSKPHSNPQLEPSGPNPNPSPNPNSGPSVPSSSSCSTPRAEGLLSSDSVHDDSDIDKIAISTIYTRRKTVKRRSTRKAVLSGSSSCPPIGRVKSTKENLMVGDGNSIQPMASSVPCQKAKKKQRENTNEASSRKPILPPDFVEEQRAYFAEIDSFELPEEEVSESELE